MIILKLHILLFQLYFQSFQGSNMKKLTLALLAGAASLLLCGQALAVPVCDNLLPNNCIKPNSDGSLNTSAGAGSFAYIAPVVTLTAGVTTTKQTLTTGGSVGEITNNGTVDIFYKLGPSASVTAALTDNIVKAGETVPFSIGANTGIAVISASANQPVLVASGTGSGYAVGGGGSSTGGSTGPTGNPLITPITTTTAALATGNDIGGLLTIALGTSVSVYSAESFFTKTSMVDPLVICVFGSNPTGSTFTDHGAFTIAAADVPKLLPGVGCKTITPNANPTGEEGDQLGLNGAIPTSGALYIAIKDAGVGQTPASTTEFTLGIAAY
jgi:hypothetical protein